MSTEQGRVAALLLKEAFGEVVEGVGSYLIKYGCCSLPQIIKGTDIDLLQVKKSLCVLIQHQLVIHETQKKKLTVFRIDSNSILQRVRFPRCIHVAKELFGDAGEFIVEDVLLQGHTSMSQNIERVSKRFEEAGIKHGQMKEIIKKQFESLVKGHFLQQVKPVVPELDIAGTSDKDEVTAAEKKNGGSKRKRNGNTEEECAPMAKKRKKNGEECVSIKDTKILWQVNHERFRHYFRDKAIISGVTQQVDEMAATVIKTILTLSSDMSNPIKLCTPNSRKIFTHQIAEAMTEKPKEDLDQYLKVLVDQESSFLRKSEDSGSGGYVVDYKKSSEIICRTTIECIVKERFGSKIFRVFRLLLLKKMLDQKQVADMAMVPSKEAKEILYTLLAENFLTLQEIPKTNDYAPSRTFYLFSVQLLPVAIMVRERCFKALGNLISKIITEKNDNSRLLERARQHERQLSEMKNGVMAEKEMEEMLTPDEKEKVDTIKRNIVKLEHAELQLDETILAISDYIELHTCTGDQIQT